MNDIPFAIPASLVSYVIQYETSPDKAIQRLEGQLRKRGVDPVGYFILGWFYHRKEEKRKAIQCALKAKSYAPGSPFFKKLHYYFSHPDVFDAWHPFTYRSILKNTASSFLNYESIEELEILIEKLSALDKIRKRNNTKTESESGNDLPLSPEHVNNIVSETLADIHEKQGKSQAAITVYEKLIKVNHKKKDDYQQQIERIKKEMSK
jgi:tetratricopeptide (TPR) repeat protein